MFIYRLQYVDVNFVWSLRKKYFGREGNCWNCEGKLVAKQSRFQWVSKKYVLVQLKIKSKNFEFKEKNLASFGGFGIHGLELTYTELQL